TRNESGQAFRLSRREIVAERARGVGRAADVGSAIASRTGNRAGDSFRHAQIERSARRPNSRSRTARRDSRPAGGNRGFRFAFRRNSNRAIERFSRCDEKARRNSARCFDRAKTWRKKYSPSAHRQRAMIGITFALPSESSDLVRRLEQLQREENLLTGKIDNREVAIVHTGVGAKFCNERLEIL